jgi:hypothetical protein
MGGLGRDRLEEERIGHQMQMIFIRDRRHSLAPTHKDQINTKVFPCCRQACHHPPTSLPHLLLRT